MAAAEDKNFNTACFRERSKAQMLLGKILNTVSAAAAVPSSQPIRRRDEGLEGERLVGRNVEKRGLLNIDLNVAPPEDADSELTAAEGSTNGQETRPPPPPADVAPDVSGSEVVVIDKREPDFDGIAEEVGVEVETKPTKISVDAEAEMVEKNSRKKRWTALLEFAENALVEKEEEGNRNRKRRASQESELGGERQKGTPTRSGRRRQSLVAEWNGENEVAAVVVRSSRGRAVAMPNKYRDSVLGAVAIAEAELPRRNKSGKSATVFSTKRKSR